MNPTAKRLTMATAVLLLLGLAGWWVLGGTGSVEPGELHVAWRGAAEGDATVPASVAWCPATRSARINAVSGDTGLMVVLFETDSIVAEVHPVLAPELRNSPPRPGAVAAFRWVEDTTAIHGYRSASGLVNIEATGRFLTGHFDIRMRHAVAPDTLVVRGRFVELPVSAQATGCT